MQANPKFTQWPLAQLLAYSSEFFAFLQQQWLNFIIARQSARFHQTREDRMPYTADPILPLDDPEFYPLVAKDFYGLPRTIAFSADVDPLRDDSAFYVEQVNSAGGNATVYNEAGLVHDYLRARHGSKKAADSFRRIGEAITEIGRNNL